MSNFYLWVIYERPTDYPNSFVARKFVVNKPTGEVVVCNSLEDVREAICYKSLQKFQPAPEDDPKIIEIWL